MSSDDRRFLFCTHEHCHDGLDFKSGCWRKWCRSRAKFYSLHGSHRHKCGAPSRGSTYSYILSRDAEAEGGFRFVSKSTAEGIAVRQELGWGRTDLVWVPAGTQLVPSVPASKAAGKRQREAEEEQYSQPPLKKQAVDAAIDNLCSAGCVLLNAVDGAAAIQTLEQLQGMQNAVLRNTELSICYCSRCRASLAVVAFQELPDSDVPVQPEELFCSQCCNDSMTMVRLATTEQLQDWLTVLHSKPSCKQPRVMQVIWPTVIHSVKPSLQVDLQDLLRGISHASLQA
ncbi:hypothetical protein ABBQ38_011302 [Trebouxia sp. C0009 RCD-2024]